MTATPLATTPEVADLAVRIAIEPAALDGALSAVGPDRIPQPIREQAAAALKAVARDNPDVLIARWDELHLLLEAPNAYTQMATAHLVGILAPAAGPERVVSVLPALARLLAGQVSVSGHALVVLGEIGHALPQLRGAVTASILGLDAVAIPDRLGLLRSYAIEALDSYLEADELTPEVIAFVVRGLSDGSKTKKIAQDTLSRWGVRPAR